MDEISSSERVAELINELNSEITLFEEVFKKSKPSETDLTSLDKLFHQILNQFGRTKDWEILTLSDSDLKLPGSNSIISEVYQQKLLSFLRKLVLDIEGGRQSIFNANTLKDGLLDARQTHLDQIKAAESIKNKYKNSFGESVEAFNKKQLEELQSLNPSEVPALKTPGSPERLIRQINSITQTEIKQNKNRSTPTNINTLKDTIFDRLRETEEGIPERSKAPTTLKLVMEMAYREAAFKEAQTDSNLFAETAAKIQTITLPSILEQSLNSINAQEKDAVGTFLNKIKNETEGAGTAPQPNTLSLLTSPATTSPTLSGVVIDLALYELGLKEIVEKQAFSFVLQPVITTREFNQDLTTLLQRYNHFGRLDAQALKDLGNTKPQFIPEFHALLTSHNLLSADFKDNLIALREDLYNKLSLLGLPPQTIEQILKQTTLFQPGVTILYQAFPDLTRRYTKDELRKILIGSLPAQIPFNSGASFFDRIKRFFTNIIPSFTTGAALIIPSGIAQSMSTNFSSGFNSVFGAFRGGLSATPFGKLWNRSNSNIQGLIKRTALKTAISSGTLLALVLVIAVAAFVFVPIFTDNQTMTYLNQFATGGAKGLAAPPADYLASGTCPIDNPVISNGTFRNGKTYDPGHGTESYWEHTMLTPYYRFAIPDGRLGYADCIKPPVAPTGSQALTDAYNALTSPACPYYGLAIDLNTLDAQYQVPNRQNTPVKIPSVVCSKTGVCTDENTVWTPDVYDTGGVGQGVILTAETGGITWKLNLLHIVYSPRPSFTAKPGENIVGHLFQQKNSLGQDNTHLHFELSMNGEPQDPTPFCDGTYKPHPYIDPDVCEPSLPGEICCVPQKGYCSTNDPVTNLTGLFGDQVRSAAQICKRESITSDPTVINNGCLVNRSAEYSVGLFQINLLVRTPQDIYNLPPGQRLEQGEKCEDAFGGWDGTISDHTCFIANQSILDRCQAYLQDPANNAREAKKIYDARFAYNGRGWQPWSTAETCQIPGR